MKKLNPTKNMSLQNLQIIGKTHTIACSRELWKRDAQHMTAQVFQEKPPEK